MQTSPILLSIFVLVVSHPAHTVNSKKHAYLRQASGSDSGYELDAESSPSSKKRPKTLKKRPKTSKVCTTLPEETSDDDTTAEKHERYKDEQRKLRKLNKENPKKTAHNPHNLVETTNLLWQCFKCRLPPKTNDEKMMREEEEYLI